VLVSPTVHTAEDSVINLLLLYKGRKVSLCGRDFLYLIIYLRDSCSPYPVSALQAGACPEQNRDSIEGDTVNIRFYTL